jgi:DNA helicase-2/ATP-dependent DNA helicase PcrA
MVENGLEPEVIQIFKHIENNENFLLSGGAGSGKTYSLVAVIKEIIKRDPKATLACITYTNAAVHEIEQRVSNDNLRVSTIHDFLWDTISSFQREMKSSLLELINTPNSNLKNPNGDSEYVNDFVDGIKYKEHLRIKNGEISHDEVVLLANFMYKKYIKLCDILKDKYQYLLVDEYQDTSPLVIEILLDALQKSDKVNIVGFFGDSMQSIYEDGVGDLDIYIASGIVKEVQKLQNRRNPLLVINLANQIRTDGLEQKPSCDDLAPNMENGKVIEGSIKFVFSESFDLSLIKKSNVFHGWDFKNSIKTKELRLTHNLIADEAGYKTLMTIYDSDPLVRFKTEFNSYIKDNKIEIDEDSTFDKVIIETPWNYRSGVNIGKSHKEVFLESLESRELFDFVKDWTFIKVKQIYFDKDNLISDKKEADEEKSTESKRDKLIRHLFKIQHIIFLYQSNKYNEFMRKTAYKINTLSDKSNIKILVDQLISMKNDTIENTIEFADQSGLCLKDDNITEFIKKNEYLYSRVKQVKYSEFESLYLYLEGYVPLSTQHKIKGSEFDNVLILLNNGGWNNYNFEYLFNTDLEKTLTVARKRSFPKILKRTQKLFYVCCTRTKKNLVVFCQNPTMEMKANATVWFGKKNVIDLDQ